MFEFNKSIWGFGVAACALAFGCSTEVDELADEASGVDVALDDGIETQDMGTSYGGWTHVPLVNSWNHWKPANWTVDYQVTFTRSSGPSTRGGGACVVFRPTTPVYCTVGNDQPCYAAAHAIWGSISWGYCVSGACLYRPTSQSSGCTLGPSQSPGTIGNSSAAIYFPYYNEVNEEPHALSCMTKAAGPSYACGGSDQSLYMRAATWPAAQ